MLGNHIIVNYHYVEDPRDDRRVFYPCSIVEFERQIAFLAQEYRIANISAVYTAAQKGSEEKLCALTFDDGLRDQYEYAAPILERFGVTATFFIIGMTQEGKLPATHVLHLILSRFETEELVRQYNGFLQEWFPELLEQYRIPLDRRLTEKRKMRDPIPTANFKEMMNVVPGRIRKKFLEEALRRASIDEREVCRELFMQREEILSLAARRFAIGSHGYTHRALDCLTFEQQERDIRRTHEILADVEEQPFFSYPHGGYNDDTIVSLRKYGYQFAVTVLAAREERRGVHAVDPPFTLPRYDTNDIRDFLNKEDK